MSKGLEEAIYHPMYLEGYKDALKWALSLDESCGDWLNEAIEEEYLKMIRRASQG